jgi:hypothetical protein
VVESRLPGRREELRLLLIPDVSSCFDRLHVRLHTYVTMILVFSFWGVIVFRG